MAAGDIMSYQHAIVPPNARLEVSVEAELYGRWYVRYRLVQPGFEHLDDWNAIPHCEHEEAVDVVTAVAEGFLQDYGAQGLF